MCYDHQASDKQTMTPNNPTLLKQLKTELDIYLSHKLLGFTADHMREALSVLYSISKGHHTWCVTDSYVGVDEAWFNFKCAPIDSDSKFNITFHTHCTPKHNAYPYLVGTVINYESVVEMITHKLLVLVNAVQPAIDSVSDAAKSVRTIV